MCKLKNPFVCFQKKEAEDMVLELSFSTLRRFSKRLDLQEVVDNVQLTLEQNPYKKKESKGSHIMWKEQCLINYPMLYLASLVLYQFGEERHCNNFLFATRDCCHWQRIFKALFPDTNVHYFDSSRNMLENATLQKNEYYDQYVASITGGGSLIEKSVYIDIHGSGKRMFEYFERRWKKVPYCFLLTVAESGISSMPTTTQDWAKKGRVKGMSFGNRGGPIEMLNYDLIGTCQGYNQHGAIRDKIEYDVNRVRIYHDCMNRLIANTKPFSETALSEIFVKGYSKRSKKWYYVVKALAHYTEIIENEKPIISKYITHVGKHPKRRNKKRK